jgi:putative chitinase
MSLTKEQFSAIAPTIKEPKLSTYTMYINETLKVYGINTPSQVAMFIAQIMHESGACIYTKELASGEAYEGRKDLGNVQKGDGVRFKGRGLIQITGRANYAELSKAFGVDFINKPELLETPEWATKSAGWFWNSRKLNSIAVDNTEDAFKLVTKRINGGYNGLEDRKNYWARAKKVLGV